jgi:predicted dehydrogenase
MIGVAIVGCGQISSLHLAAYANHEEVSVTALVDTALPVARQQQERFGLQSAVVLSDYRDALARPDVDLVEILVPHHLHLEVALAALEAGKHVSLQKPMGLSLDEADQLVTASSASTGLSHVFENFIFYPPVVRAKQIIDSGEIGDVLAVRIKSNAGYNEAAWPSPSEAWRYDRDKCGGGPMVFDDGHHKFALAWLIGGLPESVHAWIQTTVFESGAELDVPSLVSWKYRSGAVGSFEATYSPELFIETEQYPQDDQIEVTGTKGVLWVSRGHGKLRDVPPVVVRAGRTETSYDDFDVDWASSFRDATSHFLAAIEGVHEASLSFPEARDILRFAMSAETSSRTGVPVAFDESVVMAS